MGDYRATYERSLRDPEGFWREQAGLVDWIRKPQQILDADRPPFYRWFPDASLNTCFNALDRHVVSGAGDRAALVYDSRGDRGPADLHVRRAARRGRGVRRRAARRWASRRATGW